MNKKIITVSILIVLFILILILIFPIPILHGILAETVSSPCGYSNFAWGEYRGECECAGIKIDTSCIGCADTGGSEGCIGIVNNRTCYKTINGTEIQISCK